MMAETITGWRALGAAEKLVLEAVRAHPHGAQRFLVDPARFLQEAGFVLSSAFAAQLAALPGVRVNPGHAYEEVMAGRHPLCRQPITITSLGLPKSLRERA
jgi:hypothetical protein